MADAHIIRVESSMDGDLYRVPTARSGGALRPLAVVLLLVLFMLFGPLALFALLSRRFRRTLSMQDAKAEWYLRCGRSSLGLRNTAGTLPAGPNGETELVPRPIDGWIELPWELVESARFVDGPRPRFVVVSGLGEWWLPIRPPSEPQLLEQLAMQIRIHADAAGDPEDVPDALHALRRVDA
ncbi:MAG: hypothetical protein EP330_06590 [Deltaproteobacteria bacterium]|nr:MAG: hypothetical protein EP330_06590 [Deltaproteobacteria bacterium]